MVDALGAATFWGFSAALDLQDSDIRGIRDLKLEDGAEEPIQILLIGGGDIRHLLMTVARAWRHRKRKLKFFIIEGNLELYIRQLLLLHLILESPKDMGLQEKTEFFLEIFGNTLIRQQVFDYIVSRSNELLRMVTDEDYLSEKMPSVHLSALKFKERDQMEAILKFLRNPNPRTADIAKMWDNRVRKYLDVRYDSRKGSYDWDYSMKLNDRGKGVMHTKEYAYWRETGIAFGLREADYNIQNRTLVSGLIIRKGGERRAERGYWGDIVCSPYLSYGIESEEQSFFKKSNGVYTKTSQEVSVFNVMSLLHELTHKEKYVMPTPKPAEEKKKEESKLVEITEEDEEEEEEEKDEDVKVEEEKVEIEAKTADLMPMENIEIHYLPIGSAPDLQKKSKYKKAFDVVYFSNSMVHHLTPDVSSVFADRSTIICETARYMLELNTEQCQDFVNKVTAMAKHAGCQASNPVDGMKCSTMRFTFERKGES